MIISKKSWHYRLLSFLGWVREYQRTSLCPYFWKLVWAITLFFAIVPYLVMGMSLDAYVMFSPDISTIITETNEATKLAMEEAGKEYTSEDGISPASAFMEHWNITNPYFDWFLTISMVLGIICWMAAGCFAFLFFLYLLKAGFEKVNEKTGVGSAIGSTVGKPAKATKSIFGEWYKAHKAKHCPLIEFED